MSVPPTQPPDPIIGIDLGTTNSLVAIAGWPGPTDQPRVIPDAEGHALVPSAVRFDGSDITVGHAALRANAGGGVLVRSSKRLMGRALADAAGDTPYLPFRVTPGPNDTVRIDVGNRSVTPQEVAAHILAALKSQASAALGGAIRKAVITVPAYFDDAQRQATRDAARLAGLDPVRILAEPTAAALAYGLGTRTGRVTNVVVYDLGGGTFDVSVLRITPGTSWVPRRSPPGLSTSLDHTSDQENPGGDRRGTQDGLGADAFQVLATAGDTRLGGDDFDHAIVRWFVEQLLARHPNLHPDDTLRATLKNAAEAAKIELTARHETTIHLAALGERGGVTLTRAAFESMIAPLVDRTLAACKRALRDAARDLAGDPIDAVILVGGSTRVPLVRARVAAFFGITPYTAIDPDQAVAIGAAVQASVLAGAVDGALLLDVLPLSLGIETAHGGFAKLIMRNTPIPASAHDMFSTQLDGQTSVKINVLQGEREMAADCRKLGAYDLRGIPPMPAGIPQVRVEFRVDASGVLAVSAEERRSGTRLDVQIVPHHGLSRDEVDRLERESFAHARDDMRRHRIADLLANSRLDLNWIAKQRARHDAALTPAQRDTIDAATAALRSIAEAAEKDWKSADPDAFHRAKETLDRASIPLHEASITRTLKDPRP